MCDHTEFEPACEDCFRDGDPVAAFAALRATVEALTKERDALKASIDLQYAAQTKEGTVFLSRALAAEQGVRDMTSVAANWKRRTEAAESARDEALAALRELLAHPSDDPMDATNTPDGYTLTPLQQAERRARAVLAKQPR
jgi:hypothetical protein